MAANPTACRPTPSLSPATSSCVSRRTWSRAASGCCRSSATYTPRARSCSCSVSRPELERHAQPGMIPFVVDHDDGVASFGFAESRWALDLYEWTVRDPAVPEEQRHRIIGLLLGYGAPAVARYEDERARAAGSLPRRPEPAASWRHDGSGSTAGTSRPCSARSASRDSRWSRYPTEGRSVRCGRGMTAFLLVIETLSHNRWPAKVDGLREKRIEHGRRRRGRHRDQVG